MDEENIDIVQKFWKKMIERFGTEVLEGTLADIQQEIEKLPERHAHVWDIFNGIDRSLDAQYHGQHLEDEDIRDEFYERLSLFARTVKMALSTFEFIQIQIRKRSTSTRMKQSFL